MPGCNGYCLIPSRIVGVIKRPGLYSQGYTYCTKCELFFDKDNRTADNKCKCCNRKLRIRNRISGNKKKKKTAPTGFLTPLEETLIREEEEKEKEAFVMPPLQSYLDIFYQAP